MWRYQCPCLRQCDQTFPTPDISSAQISRTPCRQLSVFQSTFNLPWFNASMPLHPDFPSVDWHGKCQSIYQILCSTRKGFVFCDDKHNEVWKKAFPNFVKAPQNSGFSQPSINYLQTLRSFVQNFKKYWRSEVFLHCTLFMGCTIINLAIWNENNIKVGQHTIYTYGVWNNVTPTSKCLVNLWQF